VVKPSKQVPDHEISRRTSTLRVPEGVFNLINGDRAVARPHGHPDVQGVSVVGSNRPPASSRDCARNNKRFRPCWSKTIWCGADAKMDDVVPTYDHLRLRLRRASAAWPPRPSLRRRRVYKDVTARFIEASRKVIVANPHRPKVDELWVDADWRRSPFWTPR